MSTSLKMVNIFGAKRIAAVIFGEQKSRIAVRFRARGRRCFADAASGSSAPLRGVRVLDMTRVLAGPYCSMMLGDHGAEVLKVERPGHGDDSRKWGPPWLKTESAYFISINRNKKSVAVNLKSQEGATIIKQLASHCDVLVENYIPGKLAKMGLDYEQLKEIAPSLIYASITGFGQSGPYSQRGGYDPVAAAIGGLMHITGPEGGEPCRVGIAMTDISTGLYAFGAIMAALLQRTVTNMGQHIDCNLLNTQIAAMSHIASNYLNCGMEGQKFGSGHPSVAPLQAFVTEDGRHLMVGAGNDGLFRNLCERVGLADLATDDRYVTNERRIANRISLIDTLKSRFLEKPLSEWMEILEGSIFPYGPVNSIQQAFEDPQVLHNGMIQTINHKLEGQLKIPGPAVRYSDMDTSLKRAPPGLGEHTDEVLSTLLKYDDRKLSELRDNGVIG